MALIPFWPPSFPSLNAARDHIASISYTTRFSYTYWPEVEPTRYRLFVNFNTAKEALQMGAFRLGKEECVRGAREEWAAAIQSSEDVEKSEGEVTDTDDCGDEDLAREPVVKMEDVELESEALPGHVTAATATTACDAMDVDHDTDRDSDAASVSRFDGLEDRLRHVEGQVADVHKARDDPFKVSTISFA